MGLLWAGSELMLVARRVARAALPWEALEALASVPVMSRHRAVPVVEGAAALQGLRVLARALSVD